MKQSTLFSVFTKNTTLNETSSHLDHSECNNVNVKTNADKSKNTSKHSAQAESSLALDVSPNNNVRNTKVNQVSLLNDELDKEDKTNTTKDENINCKQGKLSLSCVKKSNAEVSSDNKSESKSETKNQIEITGKFVTVQTKQLNVQSQIKESKQNTSVVHSDTHLFSDAIEKKGVSSINYADFLAQLANKNEKKIRQNNEVSTLCAENENNETKQVMSYSEFLGMFKPPPKVEESTITIDDDEPQKCPLPLTEQQKEVKCKSIASFFTKIESKPQKINSSDVATVTVFAEVHSKSSLVKHKKSIEPTHTMKLPGKMENLKHDNCEIEFLSSETISDVEVDLRKKVQGTKRNSEAVSLLLQVSKKQKVEQESGSHKQTVETAVKKSKNETQSDISMKALMETPTISKKNNCLHGGDETSTEAANDAKIEPETPVTTPASSVKSSQATLHFGTSGLSLKKAAGIKIDTGTEEDTGSAAKILVEKTIEKRLSGRNKVGSEEEKKLNICKGSGKGECESETKSEEKNINLCKRKDIGMDCKEPAASVKELSQASTRENMEIDEDAAQMKTEETGTLRRSARLAQSFHASADVDVVEITSDDEEDVDLHEPKKRGRKGTVTKSSTTSGSPGGDWQVKTKGKMAPIFTSVKSKELVGKVLSAPIDPEQERLRREFMMSGIPDELKRHIATTVANTNLVLDYPPLPTISHVQQISVDDCLSVEIKIPKLQILDDSFHSTVGMWESLGWKKMQNADGLHRDPFKMFTANPSVQGPHVNLLLQELQYCDGKFPFRRTHEHLHSKVICSEIASTDTAGNKPTVIDVEAIDDDDDVIVCDTLHISDLHPVKNTSESKASLWSDLHQPDSSEHIIGNTKAMKQLKEWLEEWKVVLEKQVRKASKISKNTNKSKNKGGWSDDSDFTDSEEEEETLCNSVLITGAHGIGKTASVYALAKELGYKVFEVNSSSLRSGKQLLAQLEEATQSHRVAQNKNKSAGVLDTPPAGSSKKLDIVKGVNSVSKPNLGSSAAFANLFRLTPQAEETNKASQSKNRASKLTLSSKESRIGSIKKNGETPSQKIIESVPARSQRKKKNVELAEIGATKLKNQKNEDKKVGVKSQTIGEYGLTSGSLNLTSASLILFDEVDVVFEEDKGFLATVQHFMMSTKIPIVLTSTDAAFHLQLQARHDHIRLSKPPLVNEDVSAASFLSTLCLAHGVRISHNSVLNALRYTKGDIRRCLLNLQYWCESGGGVIQVTRNVDPNSLKNNDIVNGKSMKGNLAKTFRSRMVSTDDSNDSDFISLRPPRKKAKHVTSDDDSSIDTFTAVENSRMVNSPQPKKIGTVSVKRNDSKLRSIPSRNQANVIMEDASSTESCQLPLVHTGFEESLLGLHHCDMSLPVLVDLIKTSALSCQALDHAVNTFSLIDQALDNDIIYHVALHSLPLPKVGQTTPAQLTISVPLEAVAAERISSKKPRKRIMQGDWMDSDSSDADSHVVKNAPLDCTNIDEHSQENFSCKIDSDLKDELLVNSIPEKELLEKNKCTNGINNTETESKPSSNSLTKSILAEFTRYYDNLSYTDYLETKSLGRDFARGIHVFPGLSDDETHHSKLAHHTLRDQLECYTGSVKVLAARQFCSNIGDSVKNYKQYSDGHVGFKDSSNAANCNDNDGQSGMLVTDWPEQLHLPLQNTLPDLWSIAEKPQNRNMSSDSAFKKVSKCLPLVQSSDPALCLDYVPYLRDICRSEDGRRLAKTQRRFHHYLNSIGFSLKESTIASLTSTYVTIPNGKQQDS